MKTIDILNKKFSVLGNVDGYTHHSNGLSDYTQTVRSLNWIIELGKEYKNPINRLRNMEYHSTEQKAYKERFPCWFTGGTFPIMKTEDEDILEYSNILAIDIDRCDNPSIDINELKHNIFELPYVFLVSKSISGEGIYALVLLEDGRYTKEYYEYITKLWNKKFNANIDQHCTNIGRKRFISFDDDMLVKPDDIDIKEWKLKLIPEEPQIKSYRLIDYSSNTSKSSDTDLARKAIWHLLNVCNYSIDDIKTNKAYSVWYHIGCDFRHFTDGEDMFIKFSNNTSNYKDSINKIISKWNQTTIETPIDDVCRKWCGICKNKYGKDWISTINQQYLF